MNTDVELIEETKKEEQKVAVKKSYAAKIELNEKGLVVLNNLEDQLYFCDLLVRSKMVPRGYTTAQEVAVAFQTATELGLKPMAAINNIAIINGSPSLWGNLPLALLKRDRPSARVNEFTYDKDYNVICFANKNMNAEMFGACCIINDGHEEVERHFTIEDAKTAKLWGKTGPWQTYPKRMMQMRARSIAIKDFAPNSLLGINIAEYDFNTDPSTAYNKRVTHDGGALVSDLLNNIGQSNEEKN